MLSHQRQSFVVSAQKSIDARVAAYRKARAPKVAAVPTAPAGINIRAELIRKGLLTEAK